MEQSFEKVMAALARNNMQGIYAKDKKEAVKAVEKMLFSGCTITVGGSVSVRESGVWDLISDKKYSLLDRGRPGITPDEQQEAYRAAIGCDFFFCSANALTENGELVNVDGLSNRVASICFGPRRVVLIVGVNKLVRNVEEGLLRIKHTVAPKNCVRLGLDTPCARLGHCIAMEKSAQPGMTEGCQSDKRICASYVVSARQRIKNRITVILCGEALGY